MFVVTMTQRAADTAQQNAAEFHQELQERLGYRLPDSWVPDAFGYGQVFSSAAPLVETALHAMRRDVWQVGIGIGSVVENGSDVLAGSAVTAAKAAVAMAAKQGQLVPLRVATAKPPRGMPPTKLGVHAQSVLQLLGHIVSKRTVAEWAVLDRLVPGVRGQQRRVAEELGMTVQAVSQAVKRSLYSTEHEARDAVALLLEQADDAVRMQSHGISF